MTAADGFDKCSFKDSWDPGTLEPLGPECGAPAAEVIHWRDGRASPACGRHGVSVLAPDARRQVARVTPVR